MAEEKSSPSNARPELKPSNVKTTINNVDLLKLWIKSAETPDKHLTEVLHAKGWTIGSSDNDETWDCEICRRTSSRNDAVCAGSDCKGVNPHSFMDHINRSGIDISPKGLARVAEEVSGEKQNFATYVKRN